MNLKKNRSILVSSFCVSALIFLSGCSASLPVVSDRLSYQYEEMAVGLKSSKTSTIGPVSLKWIPSDFPSRVDVQGASGYVGALSRTHVPTGIALSSRIKYVLDKTFGIDPNSSKVLTITVIEAKSTFSYGFSSARLSSGKCHLKAKFEFNGKTWEEEFVSQDEESKASTYSYGSRVENAWDQVALQVGKSVIDHLTK